MNKLECLVLGAHAAATIRRLEEDIKQYLWNVNDLVEPPTREQDHSSGSVGAASIEAYWRMQIVHAQSLISALKTVLNDYCQKEESCL